VKLSLDFVRARATLTWAEIEFGIRNGWLDTDAAVELAMDQVARESSPSRDVLELASILQHERGRIPELIERLARSGEPLSKEKWLYLLMAWVYCNRSSFVDPFQTVEEIYQSFDYPEEITSFVRYMPAKDPKEGGEDSMLRAWRSYLDEKQEIFGEGQPTAEC
jgi:hypothetical protein